MKQILLCTSNPLLLRSLYGRLRDEGYAVEGVERPALAVQKVLDRVFDCTIIDAEPFGLSAEEAARIIRTIAPEMPILRVGGSPALDDLTAIKLPADLCAILEMLHHVAA